VFHYPIPRDPVKKCAQLTAFRLVFVRLSNQQEKYFLNDLFGRPGRTCHAQRIPIERRLVLLVKREERLFIAACRTLEQRVRLLVQDFHLRVRRLAALQWVFPMAKKKVPANGESKANQSRSYEESGPSGQSA
jgi:hypothetical protein